MCPKVVIDDDFTLLDAIRVSREQGVTLEAFIAGVVHERELSAIRG